MGNWMVVPSNSDILHYGVKRRSGRYPWGSGERPYQGGGGPIKRYKAKKTAKAEAAKKMEAAKKKQQEAAAKEAFEKVKELAIQTGDRNFLYKYRASLTNDDIQRAIDRINQLERIRPQTTQVQTQSQPSKSGGTKLQQKFPKFDAFTKNVDTATKWAKTYTSAYKEIDELMRILNQIGNKPTGNAKKK